MIEGDLMPNILNIDLYENGYNNFGINCIDEAIAHASGYYGYYNYFWYCFLYSVFVNWADIHFPENQKRILNKLGLTIKNNEVNNIKSLYFVIKDKINNRKPICAIVDYFYLFYNEDFYKRIHTPHGVVVCGFDSERSTITIRENCHIGWKAPFYELNLEKNILLNIFEESNSYFKHSSTSFCNEITNTYYYNGKSYFCDCVYSIEKESDPDVSCCKDLLQEYLNIKENNCNNNLINAINEFDFLTKIITGYKLGAAQFKRNYLESMEMFFNIIERFSTLLKKEKQLKNEFDNLKEYYLKRRSIIVSKILINAIREKPFKSKDKEELISEINILDIKLFDFMSKLYLAH